MARVLKAGQVVGSYRLVTDGSTRGAGTAQWAFAERNGRSYFLKNFLSYTWPDENAPGSAERKSEARQRCQRFESHVRRIETAIATTSHGGACVGAEDFFRDGAQYYKVTRVVEPLPADDAALAPAAVRLVLLSLAFAVRTLHESAGVVHADLKRDNVLICGTRGGGTVARLIDFDGAFFESEPPGPDDLVIDPAYLSPEAAGYSARTSTLAPGTPSDIFSLGLIFHHFLTGALPETGDYDSAAEALNAGEALLLARHAHVRAPGPMDLVTRMLEKSPRNRPTAAHVHEQLLRPPPPTRVVIRGIGRGD